MCGPSLSFACLVAWPARGFLQGAVHVRCVLRVLWRWPQGEVASIKTLAPWDGKDAVVQLEDEFSLDDLNEL